MSRRRLCAILLLACSAALASGCASNGTSTSVHGSVYYGVGWYDPYYYGGGWNGDVVVVPNPPGGGGVQPPRPAQLPSGPASRPSIPATPRPSGGGGRRR
ncbi:MAG TPA: hypothetical protein VN664_09565 [Burkholderiales bacterium]|jgi:hypothetical protein|nr:hypothetical protein [Burkholderiales bacterium]